MYVRETVLLHAALAVVLCAVYVRFVSVLCPRDNSVSTRCNRTLSQRTVQRNTQLSSRCLYIFKLVMHRKTGETEPNFAMWVCVNSKYTRPHDLLRKGNQSSTRGPDTCNGSNIIVQHVFRQCKVHKANWRVKSAESAIYSPSRYVPLLTVSNAKVHSVVCSLHLAHSKWPFICLTVNTHSHGCTLLKCVPVCLCVRSNDRVSICVLFASCQLGISPYRYNTSSPWLFIHQTTYQHEASKCKWKIWKKKSVQSLCTSLGATWLGFVPPSICQ